MGCRLEAVAVASGLEGLGSPQIVTSECPVDCPGQKIEERPGRILGIFPVTGLVRVCPMTGQERRLGLIESLSEQLD